MNIVSQGSNRRYSDSWYALQREATLAAESMASGVSILRKADYYHTAHYLQAFFRLATGLERSGKLALCLNGKRKCNEFPKNKTVRCYGHDLVRLLSDLDQVGNDITQPVGLPQTTIHKSIVRVLSDFANNTTRYYYLDVVTKPEDDRKSYDPIARWHTDVTNRIIQKHISSHVERHLSSQARLMNATMGSFSSIHYDTEDLDPIETIGASYYHSQLTDKARPYVRMYVMQLCRFVARLILGIEGDIPYSERKHIPVMTEIFQVFLAEDQYVKQRKTWSIYNK